MTLYDMEAKKALFLFGEFFFVWFRWLEIPDLEARQQRHGHSRKNGPPCLNNIPQLFVVCTDIHSNFAFATRPLWDTAILGHKQSFLGVAMLQHVTAVSLNEANHVGQIWSRLLARALGQKRHKETKRAEDLSAFFSIFQLSFGRTLCSSWAPHGTLAIPLCHSQFVMW